MCARPEEAVDYLEEVVGAADEPKSAGGNQFEVRRHFEQVGPWAFPDERGEEEVLWTVEEGHGEVGGGCRCRCAIIIRIVIAIIAIKEERQEEEKERGGRSKTEERKEVRGTGQEDDERTHRRGMPLHLSLSSGYLLRGCARFQNHSPPVFPREGKEEQTVEKKNKKQEASLRRGSATERDKAKRSCCLKR